MHNNPIVDSSNISELPHDVQAYKEICNKMLIILEEEENCIKTMNIEFIKELVQKKQDCFASYKDLLEHVLDKDLFITFPAPIKYLIKNSNDQILKQIENNIFLLKIESSILREFFRDITKQCEKPQATYGRHKKNPFMNASLSAKEL